MTMRAILFDLDDTLVFEESSAEAAFLAACELARARYGLDPQALHQTLRQRARELWHTSPARAYCVTVGISSWEGLWAHFIGDDPDIVTLREWALTYRREAWAHALADHGIHNLAFAEELATAFAQERRSRHIVYPDAVAALQTLQRDYRLALVSNGAADLQREKLDGAGLAAYFEAVVISGDLGFGKPDPRIFRLALERLGALPREAVMVGDSLERDIKGAQQAGLKGIWINRRGLEQDEGIQPDARIETLDELREALRQVEGQ